MFGIFTQTSTLHFATDLDHLAFASMQVVVDYKFRYSQARDDALAVDRKAQPLSGTRSNIVRGFFIFERTQAITFIDI